MIPASHPIQPPEKRKPLTRIQFATLILKQEGRCGCGCGAKLVADQIIDEHLNPLDSLGSNDLENRALYTAACAGKKTQTDRANRDKGRRIRGETGTGFKRKINGNPKIQGRSFDRSKTRGFDGKVRERTP